MKAAGYPIRSRVEITVDPKLAFMGYAKEKEGIHNIVVAEWALDSEMLGGFVLHELSHIHATEATAPTHDNEATDRLLVEMKEKDGLGEKEMGLLVDAFNHLQNIVVDDIVFKLMTDKESRLAVRFFAGWVTPRPTGNSIQDAGFLARNAFAEASLRRRDLYDANSQMARNRTAFIADLGEHASQCYEWLETFLETANADWSKTEFMVQVQNYLEKVIAIVREGPAFRDLR